ncbi:MAG: DUF2935 domain-containing protein [Tissierellia bacterium]|nr:DUF2935 domain-containing protein [Tissierellia bacterium]
MLSRKEFIQVSLEANLFFQRIMKEHLFFIETNLQPVDDGFIAEANILKKSFEDLLGETVVFANCAIRENILKSNELVTSYTLNAEKITSKLTGASINTNITEAEYDLKAKPNFDYTEWLETKIHDINCRSLNLLEEVIEFKEKLLDLFLDCDIYVSLYPEMLGHLIAEAKLYYNILKALAKKTLPEMPVCDELRFWNHVMEDHAEFIDGMLDPSEKDLKKKAEEFAKTFEKLVEESIKCHEKDLVEKSKAATEEIRDFKKSATEGLLNCQIKSIIPPLLADHVLREANHYLRILKEIKI